MLNFSYSLSILYRVNGNLISQICDYIFNHAVEVVFDTTI